MGFFSRTCGLSMIEIEEGDEVLVILLNLPYRYLSLGDLLTKVRHQNNRFGDVVLKSYWDKKYEDVCNDTSQFPTELPFDLKPIIGIKEGIYNGSGFIKGHNRPEKDSDCELEHLMFHKWAVKHIIPEYKDYLIEREIMLAERILLECAYLRRSPMDWLIGKQHSSEDEIRKQIELNKKNYRIFRKQTQ